MHSYPLTEQQHQQLMQALIHAEAELRAPGLTNPTQRAVTLEEIDQAIAVVRQTRGLNFIRATGARDPLKLEAQERRYQVEEGSTGQLTNLNDLQPGAHVEFANMASGIVTEIWSKVRDHLGNIVQARARVHHRNGNESYHTYRHDGRSQHDSSHDIVAIQPAAQEAA